MLNQAEKRYGNGTRPGTFGGPNGADPHEAGRRGGVQSGISRRLAPLKQLERGILESRSGAAKIALLKKKELELAEDRRRRDELDDELIQLGDWISEERSLLDQLRAERRQVDTELAELRVAIATDAGLVEWLRELGSQRVERACIAAGFFDEAEQ